MKEAEIFYSGNTVGLVKYYSVDVNPFGELNGLYFKNDKGDLTSFFPEGYAFVEL